MGERGQCGQVFLPVGSLARKGTRAIRPARAFEYDRTAKMFHGPNDSRTKAYVTGRMS